MKAPGAASAAPRDFLVAAARRSIQVLDRGKPVAQLAHMRSEHKPSRWEFPRSTALKLDAGALETEKQGADAAKQLVTKHRGEIVELDKTRCAWELRAREVNQALPAAWRSAQWRCIAGGGAADSADSEIRPACL